MTLLAVDDQPANCDCSMRTSRPADIGSSPQHRASKLYRSSRRDDVDLALLDIVMPEMDGYEPCRRIRSNPATGSCPW